jgi:hypothetical protein
MSMRPILLPSTLAYRRSPAKPPAGMYWRPETLGAATLAIWVGGVWGGKSNVPAGEPGTSGIS